MVFTAASVCQRSLYHKKINLETKISSVILLDQFQIFQNDGTRFLIRNIENFSVDQPVSDCLCLRRRIIHQIFFQCHESVRMTAVLDLSAFAKRHKPISGSSFTITCGTKTWDVIHFHKPADNFVKCAGIADVKLFGFGIFRFRFTVPSYAGS